ncbi:MAG: lysophospholipid acyltransferase family protein [Syntrophaceae bacterium]
MITDILYRCPHCAAFDWMDAHATCTNCGAHLKLVSRTHVAINGELRTVGAWYDMIQAQALPRPAATPILKSKRVRLSEEEARGRYLGFAGMRATHYARRPVETGILTLWPDRLVFSGAHTPLALPIATITSLTIESDTLIVVVKDRPPLFFDFLEESGKKWEDCVRKAMAGVHADRIIEFYPRVRFAHDYLKAPRIAKGHMQLRVPVHRTYKRDSSTLFLVLRKLIKGLIKLLFPVKVEGIENIPAFGPAIVLPNHCSFLDSVILGTFSRRIIWFMAKNSEMRKPIMKYLLTKAGAFPVRRYTTDPSAVRNAVRVVQEGHVLGIFPEGERCWDNRLLPYKFGTLRLLLAMGRPVIPVGISGAYALMPRWTSSIKRVTVTIRIGEPIMLGHIPIPMQTLSDVEQARDSLRRAMQNLIGAGV